MKSKLKYLVLCLILLTLVGCGGKTNPADEEIMDELQNVQEEYEEQGKINSNVEVGKYVKPDESCFTWEEVEDGVAITAYTGTDTAICLPEKLNNKDVVEIKNGTFSNVEILGVKLPDTLKRIGESTFYFCGTLVEIEFGENVEKIQSRAFQGCSALKNVLLNENLTIIEEGAFVHCTSLEKIDFPDSLQTIGAGAFCLSGLKEVNIPGSVKIVNESAFETCQNLQKVEISSGVQEIGAQVFEACSALKEVHIPDTVSILGDDIFSQCENVKVYISAGSPAETYVKENNVNYKTK